MAPLREARCRDCAYTGALIGTGSGAACRSRRQRHVQDDARWTRIPLVALLIGGLEILSC